LTSTACFGFPEVSAPLERRLSAAREILPSSLTLILRSPSSGHS